MRLICKHTKPLKALLICLKVHAARLFLSFPADCRIHFLTLINNLPIFQRTNLKTSILFVSVVSKTSSVFLSAKLIPLNLSTKII